MAKSILDKDFRYVPSGQTDLRKTFARVRREQRLMGAPENVAPVAKVSPLRRLDIKPKS